MCSTPATWRGYGTETQSLIIGIIHKQCYLPSKIRHNLACAISKTFLNFSLPLKVLIFYVYTFYVHIFFKILAFVIPKYRQRRRIRQSVEKADQDEPKSAQVILALLTKIIIKFLHRWEEISEHDVDSFIHSFMQFFFEKPLKFLS